MRFAVAGIVHESNSFAPVPTRYEDFDIRTGEGILTHHAGSQSTIAGYLRACSDEGVEAVPTYLADAMPAGPVTVDAFERLTAEMLAAITAAGQIDGVLLYLHGAQVADGQDDADGEIVRRVRTLVGDIPIAVTHDMHANVSRGVVDGADVTVVWRTNPHVDCDVRGAEAARLAIATARGEITPTRVLVQVPAAINILAQDTSKEPMVSLVAALEEVVARDGILSASLAEGYPWADVEAMGMSVTVITDDDEPLARVTAEELAGVVWAARADFAPSAVSVSDAVAAVVGAERTPVLVLDVGDNVGGGAQGDSVALLNEVVAQGAGGFVTAVNAPQAAARAHEVGVGGEVDVTVGAMHDPTIGPPVRLTGVVSAVSDGTWEDAGPTHGGGRFFDAGPSAAVTLADGNTVVLCSKPMGSFSPGQFTSLGIDLGTARGIIAR